MEQDGEAHQLRPMREGWYEPTGAISEQILRHGARYLLSGLPGIDAVELPQRSFWMLVPEPDDPESGLFASWGPPRLGEPFILLARDSLTRDLQLLKDEGLVHWDGEPRDTLPGWAELRSFLAVSEAWDGVHTENLQLFLELRPRGTLSISVFGGLRSPSGAWLEGYGPQVVVHGFEGSGEFVVSSQVAGPSDLRVPFQVNQPVTVVQAIALAKGFNNGGNVREVVVFRRDDNWQLMATRLDVRGVFLDRTPYPSDDIWLRDNDVVVVPKGPILRADDFLNLVFTKGFFAAFPFENAMGVKF